MPIPYRSDTNLQAPGALFVKLRRQHVCQLNQHGIPVSGVVDAKLWRAKARLLLPDGDAQGDPDAGIGILAQVDGTSVDGGGGFDQGHHLIGCTPEETRRNVRRCFAEAGEGGGFILSPSDHFFDVDLELVKAFAEEAANCIYK